MKTLLLSNGQPVLVDDDAYEWASRYRWHPGGWKKRYAARVVRRANHRTTEYLHRRILDPGPGLQTDHINGDTFDCRRENLRPATNGQNQQNKRGARVDSTTSVRNVSLYSWRKKPYHVRMRVDGRVMHLGYYATLEEADEVATAAMQRFMTHAPECLQVAT